MEMKHTKILDCTLRDGAYLIDKQFGDNIIRGIINGLVTSRMDFIEMGFLQDDGFGEGKTVYLNGKDAEKYVPQDKRGSLFTVLADYSRYSIDNLDNNTGKTFDAVRACFFKHERFDVIDFCKTIKQKGYMVFVQPVDILGYSDAELIDLIEDVNTIEPECFSIVDTFGSMYSDDLSRVFSLVDHNLIKTSKIGFHSHNNMQMSSALSQDFVRMSYGKRNVVIDSTLCGMGRGAGNTPTELIVQYLVSKMGYNYDMDVLLDIIDTYMNNIRTRCSWGYNTPYFIAGCYGSHINNVNYLRNKNSIRSKDIRFILNKIGESKRKRYDYDLLEQTYLDYLKSDISDASAVEKLWNELHNKNILIIAPGKNAVVQAENIKEFYRREKPVVVAVNYIPDIVKVDYLYFSNAKRYNICQTNREFDSSRRIITSNIKQIADKREVMISFARLIKCGWENMENSMILLLRLLDIVDPAGIFIAGFDGYDIQKVNYAVSDMELSDVGENYAFINEEISDMLIDYLRCRDRNTPIKFITESRFEHIFEETNML
ncbi:MAG: aldolase catalytic domain-containing protein [Clostridia bacterium]|nr:aldolase catalytic domain-containing protein [Clostridia bacterium]